MVSNKVKRNFFGTLSIVGVLCIISRIWDVAMAPKSGHAWFDLFEIIVLTYLCFDIFCIYRRRVKKGIKFGSN